MNITSNHVQLVNDEDHQAYPWRPAVGDSGVIYTYPEGSFDRPHPVLVTDFDLTEPEDLTWPSVAVDWADTESEPTVTPTAFTERLVREVTIHGVTSRIDLGDRIRTKGPWD